MATDIVLRSVKAAALTHAEMDKNWESLAQTVDAVTSNKTVAITDQNKILECSISTGTITLPTVANASGTDTDSFKITIKNINATSLTVDGNGSETIEGAASVTLLENEVADFALSSGATEWNITGFYNPNLVGITSTAAEINRLDGLTATTTELNYVIGTTSAIQTQINTKAAKGANSDITSLAGLTTAISISQGGTAASTTPAARTNLGVDAAGTDNSTNVTLAGTPNYLTIIGQAITRSLISLTTHITGILPIANGGTNSSTQAGARTNLGLGALATLNSVTASQIDANAVGQSEVANAAIGQGELITSQGAVTVPNISNTVLPGGLYGFYPQTAANVNAYATALILYGGQSTTYTTAIWNDGGNTGKAQQRYINASPPFNLGHGDIPLFIMLRLRALTKEVEGVYIADVPPWGYNGKTNLTPEFIDGKGDKFKFKRTRKKINFNDVLSGKEKIEDYVKGTTAVDKSILIPIDHAMKNADMFDIPHPFGGDLTGSTIIALDPLCKNTSFMNDIYLDGSFECLDEITEILHSSHLKINSESLDAGFSNQVICCSSKLK